MLNLKIISNIMILIVALTGCATSSNTTGRQGNEVGDAASDSARRKAVTLTQTAEGTLFTTDNRILFDTNSFVVKPDGITFLQRIAKDFNEKTKAPILVKGHTDNVGNAAANLQLSERRAQATKEGLVKAGVDAKRITARGYGLASPIAENTTPDGRQANRRTDIVAVGENKEVFGDTKNAEDRYASGLDKFLEDPVGYIKDAFSNLPNLLK
jgi:outer membrane protein OmpA-like peptidoglycan-associated protein